MKLRFSTALILLGLSFQSSPVFSQCSDAGVCAIGSKRSALHHEIGVSYIYGKSKTDDGLSFNTVQLDATLHVLFDSRVSILLPWTKVNGPAGSISGVGDFSVFLNQTVMSDEAGVLSLQIGAKIATGLSNSGNLPQAYQPGLGTNDLIFGASYETDPWMFALGYQFSRDRSNNAATQLKRGDDLLLRAGYKHEFEEFTATAEVLAINRLQLSSVVVPGSNVFVEVPESNQFQVNVLGRISYPVGIYSVQGLVAFPILSRKVNLDGLTRALTFSVGIQREL
jgi:hypothetical protein